MTSTSWPKTELGHSPGSSACTKKRSTLSTTTFESLRQHGAACRHFGGGVALHSTCDCGRMSYGGRRPHYVTYSGDKTNPGHVLPSLPR